MKEEKRSYSLMQNVWYVLEHMWKWNKQGIIWLVLAVPGTVFISGLVYLFVGLKALTGLFSVGSIVQYVGSINQFVSGFTNFMKELTDLRANNEAVGYYFDFMEIPESSMEEGIPVKDEPT